MSFSRQVLTQVREQAVQRIIDANAQIADIDHTLAVLDGRAPAPVPSPHFNHVHEAGELRYGHGTPEPVLMPEELAEKIRAYDEGRRSAESALTPEQVEASHDLFPSTPVEEVFPTAAEPKAQRDALIQEIVAEDAPLLDQMTFTAPPAPEPKTGGRRTNEEIAAEVGVNLEDVKEWKGGGRVSRADMEEFKKLHPAAIPGQQTIEDVGAPQPDVEEAPGMWSEGDTSGGEADYEADLRRRAQAEGPSGAEQTEPPSYEAADEAFVASDAETFEPPF